MKVKMREWSYDRSCGCCSEWGIDLTLDGKEVERTFSSTQEALEYVLQDLLGCEVEYVYSYGDRDVLDTNEG